MPSLCTVFAPIRRERQSGCCWDCGLRLCRDRTSCAAVVTAILQCCARFDLTTLVFEEQGFFFFFWHFCSHPSGLCGLTRWKMLPKRRREPFFPLPSGLWAFFCGQRQSPFPPSFYKSALFEIHIFSLVRFHLLGFCCDRR